MKTKQIITNFDENLISRYMYEQLIGGNRTLPIMSKCSANCFFCSNNQNPFKVHKDPPRHIEDVKMGLNALKTDVSIIDLSYVKKLSEGEAIQHPQFFEILSLIRKKFKHTPIYFYTNGIKLTPEFIKELVKYSPCEILFSFHSTNPEYWSKIFGINSKNFDIAYNSFNILKNYNVRIFPIIVPTPTLVGYEDLEKTVSYLSQFNNNILLFRPSFSKFSSEETKRIMNVNLDELSLWVNDISKKHNICINFSSNSFINLDFYPNSIIHSSFTDGFKNVLWCFSEAAGERLFKIIKDSACSVGNNHYGCMIKNYTYGGNIECAGLLQVNDFRIALKKILKKTPEVDLILLPKIPFNIFGEDLCGESWTSLEEEFGIKVIVA